MCWVKKYLGVEIGVSTGSTSRSLTAFFFGKNGIIYQYKLGALESISNKERYKLDNYNNTHEMIARNGKLMSALCFYFFSIFSIFRGLFGKIPPVGRERFDFESAKDFLPSISK